MTLRKEMVHVTRAGKSSKMSERRFLLGLKSLQSYVNKISKNWQLFHIVPHFQPQIKLLSLIPALKLIFSTSFLNILINWNGTTNRK